MFQNVMLTSALSANFTILRLFGYWAPQDAEKGLKKWGYEIYSITLVTFWGVLALTSEIINIMHSFGDLEKLTDASFLFLTHIAQFVKTIYLFKNARKIRALCADLNGDVFKPKSHKQMDIVEKYMFEIKFTFRMFLSMSLFSCLLWGMFPLIDRSGDEVVLPLSSYYPFETNSTPVFGFVYGYQIISTSINAACNVCMDTLASGLMILVCGELDLLNDGLENIIDYCKVAGDNNNDEADDENFNKEMDCLLGNWVIHHQSVLSISKEIGDLFSVSVLSQFAAISLIMCLTMFELTLVAVFSVEFFSMILYQLCMTVELTLYCWYGNEIILKSLKISTTAFNSDWINCSVRYKKSLLFVMVRAQVPIKLYAGNLFALSLETFAAILKTSWSYFAVLNKVHED